MAPGIRRSSAIRWLTAAATAACLTACAYAQTAAPTESLPADLPAAAAELPQDAASELENSRVGQLIERFTYAAIVGVLLLCGLGLPLPEGGNPRRRCS